MQNTGSASQCSVSAEGGGRGYGQSYLCLAGGEVVAGEEDAPASCETPESGNVPTSFGRGIAKVSPGGGERGGATRALNSKGGVLYIECTTLLNTRR